MNDNVKNPKHYQIIEGIESIDIIAGKKDALEQDIAKANEYEKIFENKKHLCVDWGVDDE